MRTYALAISALIVTGCGGNGTTTVTPSTTPPAPGSSGAPPTPAPPPTDMGGGGGGGGGAAGGGGAGGGGGGGGGVDGGGGGGGGGPACTDTRPVAVATAETQASALAVDDSNVYFVTQSGQIGGPGNLWRAPVGGGTAVQMGTFDHDLAGYVTVNATAVFTLGGDGLLQRWPKSGGAPLTMRTGSQYFHAMCLADAYGFIYICNYENHGYAQVLRQPEDGGGTTEVVTADYGIGNLAFDSAHVWFTTLHGVFGAPPAGTSGTEISIASNGVIGPIAVDDAHVYVGSQQQIYSADKRDGATLAPMVATSPSYVNQLATDGGNLYVRGALIDSAGYEHGTITRYAADGSGAALLAEAHGVAGGMVVRGPYVYFTDSKDSTVYRVCK